MGISEHGTHEHGTHEADAQEAGAVSQPEGDGPVTLSDRTEPGGQGSPDTNQGKVEPMSPTPDHPEPAVDVPTLAAMSVGSADPQAPSHPAAGGAPTTGGDARAPLTDGHGDTGPAPATGDGPAPGSSEQQAVVTGVRTPDAE